MIMDSGVTVTTIDRTTSVERLIQEQYLAADLDEMVELQKFAEKNKFKADIVWRNVVMFVLLHVAALVGVYQVLFVAKWATIGWTSVCFMLSGFGITAGAHRLWAHRCYKAKLPLQVFLLACDTMAFQNDVIEWSRDHRCHHKWTDTDADPHNTNRGFFFSHMGWLMMKKHPKIFEMGAKLDLSDLTQDPLLAFQKRHFLLLALFFAVLVPTCVPVYFWGEKAYVAFYTAVVFRYTFALHATWFINSVAHMFGYKPYDVNISPTESLWTTVAALGEGGHNYHHTFPQDYRTSEMPYIFNWTRLLLDGLAAVGLVYDRKMVDQATIQRQKDKQVQILKEKGL